MIDIVGLNKSYGDNHVLKDINLAIGVGEVLKVMKDLAAQGMTMVIVTHEMNFARTIADKVVVQEDGRIIETGTPEDVFVHPRQERTRTFVQMVFNKDKV